MKVREEFFTTEVPEIVKQLKPESKPEWGILSPQAMIEHLVGSWRISNGKAQVKQLTTGNKLEEHRKFLFSDRPYEKNVKNPIMPEKEPPPTRKPDLGSAVTQLIQEIKDFCSYYQQNPGAVHIHPIYGPLNRDGWLVFQTKHMQHHFRQFGLM